MKHEPDCKLHDNAVEDIRVNKFEHDTDDDVRWIKSEHDGPVDDIRGNQSEHDDDDNCNVLRVTNASRSIC